MSKVNSTPLILDGRQVANEVLENISREIEVIKSKKVRLPGLAVLLIGENPASHTYVKNKEKTCNKLGIYSEVIKLQNNITEKDILKLVESLNSNSKIDGILVQLPLPKHLDSNKVIESIDPKKDIDGLHPYNMGRLLNNQECLTPCTPKGIMQILKHYSINISGMETVIVGRSILVGKPLSIMLLNENATVTITHSKTKNIEEVTKKADLLISAIGKANLIKRDWVKKGAIVIDVGINKIIDNEKSTIVGDVDFNEVSNICKAITPVPGGVGPVTIAMLMSNTLKAYKTTQD